jgi:hypothetical protein
MKRKSNSCLALVTLVVADCENVGNIRKYRHVVTRFVQQLGSKTWMQAYHHWRSVSSRKQKQFQAMGWMCVDVASRDRNALDELLIQDCQHLVNCLLPQTVTYRHQQGFPKRDRALGSPPLKQKPLETGATLGHGFRWLVRWRRVLVATAAGLVLALAEMHVYYRYRLARDGLCVDVGSDGRCRLGSLNNAHLNPSLFSP